MYISAGHGRFQAVDVFYTFINSKENNDVLTLSTGKYLLLKKEKLQRLHSCFVTLLY